MVQATYDIITRWLMDLINVIQWLEKLIFFIYYNQIFFI